MTTPRFFTDPLSGATYPFKGRLTSTQMNQILVGLRGIDYALEWNQAYQWPVATTITSLLGKSVAFSRATMEALVLMQHTGATTVNVRSYTPAGAFYAAKTITAPAGGWTTTTYGVVVPSPTITVVGGATVNASAQKVATLDATTGAFTTRSMNNAEAAVGPACGVWDPYHSLFILGINGTGTTGKIETSPTGVTWTPRTSPSATTPSAIATDSAGTVVVLLAGSGNKAWRSTTGTAFDEVTMPATATWSSLTYSAGLGLWVATDASANLATSLDGQSWAAATLGGGITHPQKLASTKNLVISLSAAGLTVSTDGSTFRRAVYESPTVTVNDLWANDEIALALTNDTTDGKLRASPLFRI